MVTRRGDAIPGSAAPPPAAADLDLADEHCRTGQFDLTVGEPGDLAGAARDVNAPGATVGADAVLARRGDRHRADARPAGTGLPHAALVHAHLQVAIAPAND